MTTGVHKSSLTNFQETFNKFPVDFYTDQASFSTLLTKVLNSITILCQ